MVKIIKRNGEQKPFDNRKIRNAIRKANASVTVEDAMTDEQMDKITESVTKVCEQMDRPVSVEEIQDLVEKQLMSMGALDVAKNYVLYRKKMERARNTIRIRSNGTEKGDVTDQSLLLVQGMTEGTVTEWDRGKIAKRLVDSLSLEQDRADNIAKEVENQLVASGLHTVSSALIRELVNNALIESGYSGQLQDLTMYKVPRDFVMGLMKDKTVENSNIVNNNPEAVSFDIASLVLKQFMFDAIMGDDVSKAHQTGAIHVHDANFPHRFYCSSHSVEYIKKYGLQGLCNLNTTSRPAKTASVLTGHLNTYLASMQAYYAGALGLGYINVLYAPYLVDVGAKQMKQVAQELIFNGSQNAFSRGGQTLFLDFNIHTGVPSYLKNVPAICPGGKYMYRCQLATLPCIERKEGDDWLLLVEHEGSEHVVLRERQGKQEFLSIGEEGDFLYGKVLTYGDFDKETKRFCRALLDVWYEGDANGHIFEFPKCDFHVSAETFTDPEQYELYQKACELASHNGSTYFVFDRDSVSLASCCRLKVQITDMSLLMHPERLRTCGFGNVTINIPQCAYRAHRKGTDVFKEIDDMMDIAVDAHLRKKAFLESIMVPGGPLWQIGKPACDGKPYIDTKDCVYIIGMIGVNDAVEYMLGKQMHESDEAYDLALRMITHMYMRTKEYMKKYGLVFKLEESPAESAARRLAKADLLYYREDALKVFKGGNEDAAYYTNSIHLSAAAPVTIVERIRKQSVFHSAIESGAIIHVFVGEERPDPVTIATMMKEVFLNTQAAQVTISPEFTYCQECQGVQIGLHDTCDRCGSDQVIGETRVVGYFSRIQNWSKSKRYGELVDRHHGNYSIESAAMGSDMNVESACESADMEVIDHA